MLQSEVLTKSQVGQNAPSYLKALYDSANLDEAKQVFEDQSEVYTSSPYFFLEAYNYFYEQNEVAYADAIIDEHFGLFEDNAVILKSLAYLL